MTSEGLTLSEPESLIQVAAGLLTLEWYLSVGLAQDWGETETPFLEGTCGVTELNMTEHACMG